MVSRRVIVLFHPQMHYVCALVCTLYTLSIATLLSFLLEHHAIIIYCWSWCFCEATESGHGKCRAGGVREHIAKHYIYI